MKVLTTAGLTKLIELSKDTFIDKTNTVDIASVLATVAITGSYTDLSNKPTIPTVDQNYNATSANAQSGTAVASAISSKQPTITGAATTITSSNLTTSRALISNSNGKVAVSDTTSTELGYVHGVTSSIQTQFSTITEKIPSVATASNQLADKAFVNSSIANMAANYVTSDAQGDNFATKAALLSGPYYYKGQSYTLTNNDYALVESDETKNNATTRYMYDGAQWNFQYIVNDTPFTQAQLDAINSNINSNLVSAYNTHVADTTIHVTSTDKNNWNNKVDKTTYISKVYATDASGNQSTLSYSQSNSADSIAQRDVNGQIAVNQTPTANNHAASKKYVDDNTNNKVIKNADITGATKCKITYDSKGLVTAGANLAASDIPSLASSKITTMTGYSKASAAAAISTSDSLNTAIGKLEYKVDNVDALPSQSGQAGKYLATNGTDASWMAVVTYDSTNKRLVFA